MTQDFHLSLKRAVRRPKPNPLLQIVLLAGDRADLRASLLRQREPEPFELHKAFPFGKAGTPTSPSCPTGEGRPGSCPSWVSRLGGYVLHRTRTVVAFGLGPSPSAELALGAWEEAKAFLQAQVGRLPRALVHHDRQPKATFRGVLS